MNIKPVVVFMWMLVVGFLFSSCKKEKEDGESLTWTFKGATVTATSSYIMASGESHGNFMAAFGNNYPPPYGLIGKIHPVQPGSYSIGSANATPNWLIYRHPGLLSDSCTGTFIITSVANGKVSATFDLMVNYPSGPEPIKGSISNLIIR